jgi:hypothetical protein
MLDERRVDGLAVKELDDPLLTIDVSTPSRRFRKL